MPQDLPLTSRRILAGLLAAAGIAYGALLVATYLQTTAPSSLGPDLGELDRLLFSAARPVSPMERRLDASDTPLGTGPLITGGMMRSAFTDQSDELTKPLNPTELAQRDGERQALLDWIRSGASQAAYEQDDYALANPASVTPITPGFLRREVSATNVSAPTCSTPARVRIRSLINERCVTCHHEDGDDTARLIPLDTYESIARYLLPDTQANGGRAWLLAALISLFPLAALACHAFAFTSHPLAMRRRLLAVTIAALAILSACWFVGSFLAPVLLAAAVVAVICVMVQMLASVAELLDIQPAASGAAGLPSSALGLPHRQPMPSRPLKKGTGSEPNTAPCAANTACREVPVPLFQQAPRP
jgi:hypothetical protein